MTNIEKRQRRPACGHCGGTGYVYLWAVARAGPRTWFCDRCKRSWSEGEPILATLAGDEIRVPAAQPVLASEQQPLEPAINGGGAAELNETRPRRLRVIEPNVVRIARRARVGGDAVTAPVDDRQSSASSAPAPHEKLPL
jgi:ribosomal protein L37AE/L43A